VTCGTCGADNPAGQKFCGECGSALARTCPSCGTANVAGQKFCGECGTPLGGAEASGRPAMAAAAPLRPAVDGASGPGGPAGPGAATVSERRLVTVLFADLVGFTPFAEERDAEDVRDTLSRYFELASDVISRHGGTVEKFIGDAVMAVWGTPTAREDDAERAVRAALELVGDVRELGPDIRARAGVLTGEAAVTLGARNQGMVAGDLVNTAARVQSVAPPGTVLVGEATQRLASTAIVFEPLGEQELKGKTSPVPTWRAVRVVAERGGRGRADAIEAPFVGRDEEFRLLKDLFHATVRERRPRLVSVTGVGGAGKSRLAWEFSKYIDGIVGRFFSHHGRSPAYGSGLTFWALGEMVRQRAGLVETDDELTTRAKVAEMVARYSTDERERRWLEGAFLALFGVEQGIPPDELFGAWRTFFERMTRDGAVILLFEDLHWADSGTLDFIEHVLEWSRDVPIYIVTLARPELTERRPSWGAGSRHFASIHLEPLSDEAMAELLIGLVPELPPTTIQLIIARAEGIPLYAIETIRMLVADGHLMPRSDGTYEPTGDLGHLAVPDSLTALIAARLDALEPADRSLVLDAAVLGQSFTPPSLAAVAGVDEAGLESRLRGLVRSELFSRKSDPRSPERGQYAFMQALVREVAYNTLAKKDRKSRHLAAARYFESLETEEIAAALAGHYLAAYHLASEGPEQEALATQARLALRGAAERAVALGAHDQAVAFLSEAMSVTTDPAEEIELLERAGQAASTAARHDEAEQFLGEAIARHRQRGDLVGLARSGAALVRELLSIYRVEDAYELLTTVRREVDAVAGEPSVIALDSYFARVYLLRDEPQKSVDHADPVLAAAERLDLVQIVVETLATRAAALTDLGRAHEAEIVARGTIDLAERSGLIDAALRGRNALGNALSHRDPRPAVEVYRAGMVDARRIGAKGMLVRLGTNAVEAARLVGEWDWAIATLDEFLASPLEQEDRYFSLGLALVFRAWHGEDDAEMTSEFDRLAADERDPNLLAGVYDYRAAIAFAQGRYVEARRGWLEAGRLSLLNAPTALAVSGRAALWAGDVEGAREDLAALDATGAHGPLIEARRHQLAAGIAALEGRLEDAIKGYRTTLGEVRDLGILIEEAFDGIEMARLLPLANGEVVAAATRAREILTSLRAAPFLGTLDAELVQMPAEQRPTGTPRSVVEPAPSA
jgi:class 3 adenylate cyclase/tetratricopeptide (TPR) repeat protein